MGIEPRTAWLTHQRFQGLQSGKFWLYNSKILVINNSHIFTYSSDFKYSIKFCNWFVSDCRSGQIHTFCESQLVGQLFSGAEVMGSLEVKVMPWSAVWKLLDNRCPGVSASFLWGTYLDNYQQLPCLQVPKRSKTWSWWFLSFSMHNIFSFFHIYSQFIVWVSQLQPCYRCPCSHPSWWRTTGTTSSLTWLLRLLDPSFVSEFSPQSWLGKNRNQARFFWKGVLDLPCGGMEVNPTSNHKSEFVYSELNIFLHNHQMFRGFPAQSPKPHCYIGTG